MDPDRWERMMVSHRRWSRPRDKLIHVFIFQEVLYVANGFRAGLVGANMELNGGALLMIWVSAAGVAVGVSVEVTN